MLDMVYNMPLSSLSTSEAIQWGAFIHVCGGAIPATKLEIRNASFLGMKSNSDEIFRKH
jgi:hypothetical protein